MEEMLDKLPQILQFSYFAMNPYNPNNTEDGFQEILRHNIVKVFNYIVDSESTNQKTVFDINGDEIHLKNKTERFDLIIRKIKFIMELKTVEKIDDSHRNQLLSYMVKTDFEYGAVINFRKGKSCKELIAEAEIYKKGESILKYDMYNCAYNKSQFNLVKTIKTEDYKKIIGDYVKKNEIIID